MASELTSKHAEVNTNATYSSSTGQQQFSHSLPPVPDQQSTNYVGEKTAYLSSLRTSTKQLQDDVNFFLTQKMKEDEAASTASESTKAGSKMDPKARDEEGEENYGEEDGEEG